MRSIQVSGMSVDVQEYSMDIVKNTNIGIDIIRKILIDVPIYVLKNKNHMPEKMTALCITDDNRVGSIVLREELTDTLSSNDMEVLFHEAIHVKQKLIAYVTPWCYAEIVYNDKAYLCSPMTNEVLSTPAGITLYLNKPWEREAWMATYKFSELLGNENLVNKKGLSNVYGIDEETFYREVDHWYNTYVH